MMSEKQCIGVVISSQSARSVLKSSVCVHYLNQKLDKLYPKKRCDKIFWLTRPEFFDLVPDSVSLKVDITKPESVALLNFLEAEYVFVYDSDMRGFLYGGFLRFKMKNKINFYGHYLTNLGEKVKTDIPANDDEGYLFNLHRRFSDYAYCRITKKLNGATTFGVLGIYFGEGSPTKKLSFTAYMALVNRLFKEVVFSSIILFGPACNDLRANAIVKENKNFNLVNTVGEFENYQYLAHGFRECNVILAEDNFGLYLALALKKPVVGLFGHTLSTSIGDFDKLCKIDSQCNFACRPCGDKECRVDEGCYEFFSENKIVESLKDLRIKGGEDVC